MARTPNRNVEASRGLSPAVELVDRYGLRKPPEVTAEIGAQRWRELNRLLHCCMVLHGMGRDRRPLQRLLRTAGSLVGASRGILYVRGDGEGTLQSAASWGFPKGVPERLRGGGEISPAAMRAGKPLLVSHPEDSRLESELDLLGEPSCVSFPILLEGQPWGIVQLLRQESFGEDEAVLLWMYALVVEDALPSLSRGARATETNPDAASGALVSPQVFGSILDRELEGIPWGGSCCTILRIAFRPEGGESLTESPLQQDRALRVLRSALRPVDRLAPGESGDVLVMVPETDAVEGEQVGQKIRRALVQSRVLGEGPAVIRSLDVRVATCPDQGRNRKSLFRALGLPE